MTKKPTESVDYVAKAREYLKLEPVKIWPADLGMNERQLEILGRLVSFADNKSLIGKMDPDEWVPPCAIDATYPEPQIWFFTILNEKVAREGQPRIEERLKNLAGGLGLGRDLVKRREDGWYEYEIDYRKEGIHWYVGFSPED